MKINWGLVIALFLLAGIGAHALRTAPVSHVSRTADVPVRGHLQKSPIPDISPRDVLANEAVQSYRHPIIVPAFPPPSMPLANEPIALPAPRPEIPERVVKHKPQPKPQESTARPTYRRVLKDGALGGELACARVRPLTESERAAYEGSDGRTLFVCLN